MKKLLILRGVSGIKNLGSRLWKSYNKYIGSRLFIKFFILYILIIVIILSVIGPLTMYHVTNKKIEAQVNFQEETISSFQGFTYEKLNLSRSVMLSLYGNNLEGVSVIDYLVNHKQLWHLDDEQNAKLKNLIFNLVHSDYALQDIIILRNNNKILMAHSNGLQVRSISPSYNFSKDPLISKLQKEGALYLDSDLHPDYIIQDSEPVVSMLGNLYGDLQGTEAVGKYIVNLSSQVFIEAFNAYTTSENQTFCIVNNQGKVLVSDDRSSIGTFRQPPIVDGKFHTSITDEDIITKAYVKGFDVGIVVSTNKQELLAEAHTIRNQIILVIGLCILLLFFITSMASRKLYTNIKKLIHSMGEVNKGDLSLRIQVTSQDEIGQLGMAYNAMCSQLGDYINQVYKAEIQAKTAHIAQLQATIRPHSFNNTLELIRVKAQEEGAEETSQMLSVLGRILYWNLKTKTSYISVVDEIDYLKYYGDLCIMSSNYELEINYEIEPTILHTPIPVQSIQPLLENAIQHGYKDNKEGNIHISCFPEKGNLIIVVEDDGIGMDEEKLQTIRLEMVQQISEKSEGHIGLYNVNQRIQLLYGSAYGLSITSSKGQGTKVAITIPIQEMEE